MAVIRLPGQVRAKTKTHSIEYIFGIDTTDEEKWAYLVASKEAGKTAGWGDWGPWGPSACGSSWSASGVSYRWDGWMSGCWAACAQVEFEIHWPAIPANAVGVTHTIRESNGGNLTDIPTGGDPTYGPTGNINSGWVNSAVSTICIEAFLEYSTTQDDCVGIEVSDITFDGAKITGPADTSWQWGVVGDPIGQVSDDGILTGLQPDTEYWFKALSYCEETIFTFKTEKKKEEPKDWAATIITLPPEAVWTRGATLLGLLKMAKANNKHSHYLYLGFQWANAYPIQPYSPTRWPYSGLYWAYEDRVNLYPIRMALAGLQPDCTYYYRACLHIGPPPFQAIPLAWETGKYYSHDAQVLIGETGYQCKTGHRATSGNAPPSNYWEVFERKTFCGETLNFNGPQSIFGAGREFVTAKQAEDDISKLAVGRYYMDRNGIFRYESYQGRLT